MRHANRSVTTTLPPSMNQRLAQVTRETTKQLCLHTRLPPPLCRVIAHLAQRLRDILSFDELGQYLKPKLLRGIFAHGFEAPSCIQQAAFLPILRKHNVVFQGQAGTGKTSVLAICALQHIDIEVKSPQALILSFSREICYGIASLVKALGNFLGVSALACVGGQRMRTAAEIQAHVLVATPGRLCSLVDRHLCLETISFVGLDAVDDMIFRGFRDQLFQLVAALPCDVQVCACSTTAVTETEMPIADPVRIVMQSWLRDIPQYYVVVEEEYKLETLLDLYTHLSEQAVICVNTPRKLRHLSEKLTESPFSSSALDSSLSAESRQQTLDMFQDKRISILLCLADDVSLPLLTNTPFVTNFDLPEAHNYASGVRAARCVLSFVTAETSIHALETACNARIEQLCNALDAFLG